MLLIFFSKFPIENTDVFLKQLKTYVCASYSDPLSDNFLFSGEGCVKYRMIMQLPLNTNRTGEQKKQL